jgi:23S rRNA-/tRNA-specific pseudouridylate synthase
MRKEHIKQLRVEAPMSLLSYLRAYFPSYPSVKALKRAIDQKQCKVNGRVERFSTHPLRKGDLIELELSDLPKALPPTVLYEDEELIAYNKSAYVVSDPPSHLFAIHRLDKETTGVLLYAKSVEAEGKFSALFAERQVKKQYLALVDGLVKNPSWSCHNFLGKTQSYQGGAIYGSVAPRLGKEALTHFTCLETTSEASFVLCHPVTGRTHQIRSHLQSAKHPVLGDWHYASRFQCPYKARRYLLHAHQIEIAGRQITAPCPEDFRLAYAEIFKSPFCFS